MKVPKFFRSNVRKNCMLITDETITNKRVNTIALPSFFPVPKIFSQNSWSVGTAPIRRTTLITLKTAKKTAFSVIRIGRANTVLPTARTNSVSCIRLTRNGRNPMQVIFKRTSKSNTMVKPNWAYLRQEYGELACTRASTKTRNHIVYLK